jgi:hypothetical protein
VTSYYPEGVLSRMREDSDKAIDRLSTWMAKVLVNDDKRSGKMDADANFFTYKEGFAQGLKIDD